MTAGDQSVPMANLTIDGRIVRARTGSYVLQAARKAGIDIPTLCDHPDLEPVGACRLCLVEVTHPDWKGWRGVVTSCLYPVTDGLQVLTSSDRVRKARREVLALLAARCPNSATIQRLAREYECNVSALKVDPASDNCILCGLCTRVCEDYATSAISTFNRGSSKTVGPFSASSAQSCVGCGACAQICPTDNIQSVRSNKEYQIWKQSFPTHVVAVDEARCFGCGACEQSCPFSVARVALRVGGRRAAMIASEHCRGCGACVGACPSGALDQDDYGWTALVAPCSLSAEGGAS